MSWGAVAAGVVTAAAGAYGASQSKGASGSGGVATTTLPQYSWTEPTQRLTADYVAQNIQRMGEGQFPQWYSKTRPMVEQGLKEQNYRTYFGTPGERVGVVNEAVAGGAGAGLGVGQTTRRKQKALQDYAYRSNLIDQFLATQDINLMTNQSLQFPALAASLPAGPQSQVTPYSSQTPAYTSPWSTLGNTLAGNLPWEQMFSNTGSTQSSNGAPFYIQGQAVSPNLSNDIRW